MPDPLGVLWAIRGPGGAIADFETGYSNPAMAQMIGVPTEASMGRRLLDEAPDRVRSLGLSGSLPAWRS